MMVPYRLWARALNQNEPTRFQSLSNYTSPPEMGNDHVCRQRRWGRHVQDKHGPALASTGFSNP